MYRLLTYRKLHFGSSLIFIGVLLMFNFLSVFTAHAQTKLQNRYVLLKSSAPSVSTSYTLGFSFFNTSTAVGSIYIQFCSNSSIINDACNFPSGLNISGAVLSNQTPSGDPNDTGFSILSNSPFPSAIILTRGSTLVPDNNPVTFELDNIVNPSSAGQYYIRLQTFTSAYGPCSNPPLCTGSNPAIDIGGIAYDIVPLLTVQAVVPPYLTFCVATNIPNLNCGSATGSVINFGNFSTSATSSGTSNMLTATNAQGGYAILTSGPSLTSGNNVIPPLSSPALSRNNNNQFGINLTSNTIPQIGGLISGNGAGQVAHNYSLANNYLYNNGDEVAYSSSASDFNKYTVSYIVNINSSQPPGIYVTTISYICVGNF